MSDEVIRYGAGGVPYKSFKTEEVKPKVTPEPEPVVAAVVEVIETETTEAPVIKTESAAQAMDSETLGSE